MRSCKPIFFALLGLALAVAFPAPGRGVVLNEYGDLFDAVLSNLVENYTWQLDEQGQPIVGNWDRDEMYDSTLFAPDILYRLAADPDYGDETVRAEMGALARQTIDYEMGMLLQYFMGDDSVMLEAFAGAPCLIDALRASGDFIYNLILTGAMIMVRDILVREPNFLGEYMGYVGANGLVGYYALSFADVEKRLTGQMAEEIGLQILDLAVERYWVEEDGRFWPIYNLYEDGCMLMGLAYAYGATGNEEYKTMADLVMAEIDTNLWDSESPTGGYWEYEPYMYKPELGRWKKLSTHERIARAMLHWFEVTADPAYLDQARKMLDYVQDNLCVEDCYQPGRLVCYHHWTEVTGLPHMVSDEDDPRYDPYYSHPFCTGCNFNLLIDIYLLNKFVQESANYPRRIGACGTMVSVAAGQGSVWTGAVGAVLLALPAVSVAVLRRRYRGKPGRRAVGISAGRD